MSNVIQRIQDSYESTAMNRPVKVAQWRLEFGNAACIVVLLLFWSVMALSGMWLFLILSLLSTLCYFWVYGFPLKYRRLSEFYILLFTVQMFNHLYLFVVYIYLLLPVNRFIADSESRGNSRRQRNITLAWAFGWILTFSLSVAWKNWMDADFMTDVTLYEWVIGFYCGYLLPFHLLVQIYGIPLFNRNQGQDQ